MGLLLNEQHFLNEIRFSGWNSPPKSRQLLGDLVYLEVTTTEKQTFHITGWTGGFYVNCSTNTTFDPRPNPKKSYRSHALADLLAKVSTNFQRQFFRTVKTPGNKETHLVGGPNFLGIGGDLNGKHPYEVLPANISLVPWCGVREERHLYDVNRAEYAILEADMGDQTGNLRDWNEEWQRCKELPKHTIQERIIRDKNLQKVHADFIACVERGAVAIVNKSVAPINGNQDEAYHMYIYNNIFFSYANSQGLVAADNINGEKKHGSATSAGAQVAKVQSEKQAQERASKAQAALAEDKQSAELAQEEPVEEPVVDAYHSANNDLRGIQLANFADIEGLSTLLTSVVDYKGFRLVAQSLIPGVLATETTNIIYGSLDKGATIHFEPNFHELVKKLGNKLNLAEHEVLSTGVPEPEEENEQEGDVNNNNPNTSTTTNNEEKKPVPRASKTCLAVDSKGIVGTDGRTYLVDLVRLTPRDPNYLDNQTATGDKQSKEPNPFYGHFVLRRELIDSFGKWIVIDRSGRADSVREQLGLSDIKRTAAATSTEAGAPAPVTAAPEQPQIEQQPAQGEQKKQEEPVDNNANPNVNSAETEAIQQGLLQFNLNVFTEHHAGHEKKKEREEWVVKELGKYLMEVVIPRLVDEFSLYGISLPLDGDVLRSLMHKKGINMRYLGQIATLCREKGRTQIAELCEEEMYVRAAKHHFSDILRAEARSTSESTGHLSPLVAHFLNCLVSESARHEKDSLPLNGSQNLTNDKYKNIKQILLYSLLHIFVEILCRRYST